MAGEDTAGWKRLSVCCGDLWIVEISGGAVIACGSELCVYKWSINPFTNPNPVYCHTLNYDSIIPQRHYATSRKVAGSIPDELHKQVLNYLQYPSTGI
jgi:hypothetical protein